MRFAAAWTRLMAVAIASDASAIFAIASGGGLPAWLLALPAAFVGLHLLGLPAVALGEVLERCARLPNRWRANLHEWLIIAALLGLGSAVLPPLAQLASASFFAGMLAIRLAFNYLWNPGEPVEVSP